MQHFIYGSSPAQRRHARSIRCTRAVRLDPQNLFGIGKAVPRGASDAPTCSAVEKTQMSAISRSLESFSRLGEHRFGIAFSSGMQEIHPIDIGGTPRTPRKERRWRSNLLFVRNFFCHPRMLGSIIPSSRFLIRQLLAPVEWSRARVIVEYGPGVGVITREILRRMRSDATLIAIN
jgi:hypothetical protein